MSKLTEEDVFAKTVFAEAWGESVEGQKWVAWVIKNRARLNREYWGGNTIKGVCLHLRQFECWNGVTDIEIPNDKATKIAFESIRKLTERVIAARVKDDPTGGADHYYNPEKEGGPIVVKDYKSPNVNGTDSITFQPDARKRENWPKWIQNCNVLRRIGNHVFYKSKS